MLLRPWARLISGVPRAAPPKLIYKDRDILAFDKPAGLPMDAPAGAPPADSLLGAVSLLSLIHI